jgi:tetratricopeptide (TPR) repeat protein
MESNVSRLGRPVRGVLAGLLLAFLAGPVASAPTGAATADGTHATAPGGTRSGPTTIPARAVVTPPADPTDVQGWLAWKQAEDLPALPHAATIVHRLGNEAHARGDDETAVRLWRGAEELDPQFLAPRFTLAAHFLGRDPSQGLIEIGRIVGLARTQFRVQHYFLTYGLFYLLSALYLATIGVALVLCWRSRHRLQHVYREFLARRLPTPRASVWAWVAVALPWLFGLGLAVPAAFTLALVWSYLKKGERVAFAALVALLVASPMAMRLFDELSLLARESEAPFYSTLRVDQETYRPERLEELAALARANPENAFLAFAEGWTAQKGRRWDEAVDAYQRAQALWPREARIPNNLGNIETLRGNGDAAETHYQRAITLSPRWAAPRYNLGQLYTARYRYAEASEEIAQATALDFDLVRSLQARSAASTQPALAEEWLDASVQWPALFAASAANEGAVMPPPAWRPFFESRGLPVAVWTLLLVAVGLGAGMFLHHHLPARTCGNCAATVCRRCATRRRDQVLCVECSALVAGATTPEFGRLLLFKRRRETRKRQGWVRLALAAVVPGYGPIAFDRVVLGWTLATCAVLFAMLAFGPGTPFPHDPRVLAGSSRPWSGLALVALALTWSVSMFGTLAWQGRARESDAGLETSSGKSIPRLKRAA